MLRLIIAAYAAFTMIIAGLVIDLSILKDSISRRDSEIVQLDGEKTYLAASVEGLSQEIVRAKESRAGLEKALSNQQPHANQCQSKAKVKAKPTR